MKSFFYLLTLFILSCQNNLKTFHNSDNIRPSVKYDPQLTISTHDSLVLTSTRRKEIFPEFFDTTNSFCRIDNDTLNLFLMTGWFEGSYSMNIKIVKDTAHTMFSLRDNYSRFKYTPTNTVLIVNSRYFKADDTLIVKIIYRAIGASKEINGLKDTITVKGKLKLKVRDSKFNFEDLSVEDQRNEFYSLLHQRPDTITKLNLYGCAFTELPLELNYFRNLQELSLEGNDLSNANLDRLSDLKNLTKLNLQNCRLSRFPASILKLPKLENLSVYENMLTVIPDALYGLTALKELTIGNNNLTYLSPKISNLINLVSLETSYTDIRRYPNEMVKLKNLTEIYPSDTMIYIPHPLIKYVWGCDTILSK